MKWNQISTRMQALVEHLDDDERFDVENEESEVEGFSSEQLEAFAELMGISLEEMQSLDEEQLEEMMSLAQYKVIAGMQYGRSGMSGRHPWNSNEQSVGKATPTMPPSKTRPPSDATAKVPRLSGSPFYQKGRPHIKR